MRLTIEYTNEDKLYAYPRRKLYAEIPNDSSIEDIMDALHGLLVGMSWDAEVVVDQLYGWCVERMPSDDKTPLEDAP